MVGISSEEYEEKWKLRDAEKNDPSSYYYTDEVKGKRGIDKYIIKEDSPADVVVRKYYWKKTGDIVGRRDWKFINIDVLNKSKCDPIIDEIHKFSNETLQKAHVQKFLKIRSESQKIERDKEQGKIAQAIQNRNAEVVKEIRKRKNEDVERDNKDQSVGKSNNACGICDEEYGAGDVRSFDECRHCVCNGCCKKICEAGMPKCPFCRKSINPRKIKTLVL